VPTFELAYSFVSVDPPVDEFMEIGQVRLSDMTSLPGGFRALRNSVTFDQAEVF